jgi:GTP cyclohydrolase I
MNKKAMEKAIEDLLIAIGENPQREGLIDTPKRVVKYWSELLEGTQYSNDEIAEMFNKTFTSKDKQLVEIKNIKCFSHCEHHMALMYDMTIDIKYIPNGKVLGLSKFARICEMVTKRLQIQERIGSDIWYILNKILDTDKIEIHIKGKHSCMTARGIKNTESYTETIYGSIS